MTAHSVIRACERDINDASSVHSESCWSETEELSVEDDVEWGMLLLAGSVATQTVREEGDSAAPARGVHPPTRRLVLIGGVSGSQNRFSLLEREEEENDVHLRGRGMRVSQRCAHEFSQRSVSATVVDCTVSQNLRSQIRAEEDQSMSERDVGDWVVDDGIEREGVSEGEEHDEVLYEAVEDLISGEVQARNVSVGLQSLDEVDLKDIFKRRASVMICSAPQSMASSFSMPCCRQRIHYDCLARFLHTGPCPRPV